MKITTADISQSNDLVWDAVVLYEDGDAVKAFALVAGLGDVDRAIFAENIADIDRKNARAAEYTRTPSRPLAFVRNARVDGGGFDYELAILDRQDRYYDSL